jgi:hypothetical protein
MTEARVAAYHANAAARDVAGAAKPAAYAAGQAVAVAHVAAHYLGAAAYALKAVPATAADEWAQQIARLPLHLKGLVLEDQRNRDSLCWGVFAVGIGKTS